MYAVIKTGGKQYRVAANDTIAVERLAGAPGTMVAVGSVLMLGEPGKAPTVGRPVVDKAAVFAEVVEQARGDKIVVFKKKRRKNFRRKKGHRQDLTVLRILAVSPTGEAPKFEPVAKPAPKPKPAAKPPAAEDEDDGEPRPAKKKAAPKKAAAKAKSESKDEARSGAKAKKPAPKAKKE
jgi:large subunit ribosomal protein L21